MYILTFLVVFFFLLPFPGCSKVGGEFVLNALFKLLATCKGEVGNFNFPIKTVAVQTSLREFI